MAPVVVDIAIFEGLVRVSFRYDYGGLDLPRFATPNEQYLLLDMIRTGTGQALSQYRNNKVLE